MRIRRFQREAGPLDAIRRRMIAETELALLIGLAFPERMPKIPTMKAGTGRFDPRFASRFWTATLGVDMTNLATLCEHAFRGGDRLTLSTG